MERQKKQNRIISKNTYGIKASTLKYTAVATMLIDHMAAVVLKGYASARQEYLEKDTLQALSVIYDWMRRIGRISFPLFVFLIVEGFLHTRDRKKYAMRLALFAVLSEIPFNAGIYGTVFYPGKQNVLWTFLVGLSVLQIMEYIRINGPSHPVAGILLQMPAVAAGAGIAWLGRMDYSYKGILLIAVFYWFHGYVFSSALAGYCVLGWWEPWSFPGFVLLSLYNGKRGKNKKLFFYLFYPLHLVALTTILKIILWVF